MQRETEASVSVCEREQRREQGWLNTNERGRGRHGENREPHAGLHSSLLLGKNDLKTIRVKHLGGSGGSPVAPPSPLPSLSSRVGLVRAAV